MAFLARVPLEDYESLVGAQIFNALAFVASSSWKMAVSNASGSVSER